MLLTNFAAGELSPRLSGRTDLQQYYAGAGKLENWDIIPTGGIKRRVGFERMGTLHGDCRLIPFLIDRDTSFIFELYSTGGKSYCYVWKNGEKMIGTDSAQIYFELPYTSLSAINEMQYAQNYDEMILVHKSFTPFEIKYNTDTDSFTTGSMTFDFWPDVELDDDYDYVEIAGTSLPEHTTYDYCVYNGKLYKWDEDSSAWVLQASTGDSDIDTTLFSSDNKYPSCVTFFANRLWFASTINARQKIWASAAPDSSGNRYNDFCTYNKYVTVNKVVKDADLHLFTGSISTSAKNVITGVTQDFTQSGVLTNDCTDYYVTQSDYIPVGTKVVSVTADTITLSAEANITEDISSFTFSIQLWKNADTASADDYEYSITNNNMTTSDNAFNFEVASEQNDAVKWLCAGRYLLIGTESSTYAVSSSVTALSISAELGCRFGTDDIQAHAIDTANIYFAQGKKGIREYYYDSSAEAFITNNLALFSEQMLEESAALDFDYTTNPYYVLWIIREDGKAVTLLYDKTNGIQAWSRCTHGEGTLVSCAVTRGDEQNDLVYVVVKIGDGYYLEKLDSNDEIYLDSWKVKEDGDEDTYGDDAVTLTINDTEYIGYKYESDLISLPVVADTEKKRITNLKVRFYKSALPVLYVEDRDPEYFSEKTEPYSGIAQVEFPGTSEEDVTYEIKTDATSAVCLLTVNATTTSC